MKCLWCLLFVRLVSAQFCHHGCEAGKYAITRHESYLPKVQFHPDLLQPEYRLQLLEATMLNSLTLTRPVVECVNCSHNMNMDTFDFVSECDDDDCFLIDEHCKAKCREYFVVRDQSCVLCNHTSCAVGTYMTSNNCSCVPCSHAIQFTNNASEVQFVSNGAQLDAADSCKEQCAPGYYQDTGLVNKQVSLVCVAHMTPECSETQVLISGTQYTDARCEDCVYHCEGMRMVQNCTSTTQSKCEPCTGELDAHEHFVHSDCTKQCQRNALRNAAGKCEMCDHICAVGTFRAPNATSCEQCVGCDTSPTSNAHYVQGCVWTCNDGFAYNQSQHACVEEQKAVTYARVVASKSFKTFCDHGEYLLPTTWSLSTNARTDCASCYTKPDVITPDPAKEGLSSEHTWSWLSNAGSVCDWQCNEGRFKFKVNADTVACYDWNQFASTTSVTTSSDSVVSTDGTPLTFSPVQRQQIKTIAEWKLGLLCLVALITTLVLMR